MVMHMPLCKSGVGRAATCQTSWGMRGWGGLSSKCRMMMWESRRAAGGYGSGYGRMSQILRDVIGNRAGIGTIGIVDDDGDGLVMTDGG